jgi:hypothetical protein
LFQENGANFRNLRLFNFENCANSKILQNSKFETFKFGKKPNSKTIQIWNCSDLEKKWKEKTRKEKKKKQTGRPNMPRVGCAVISGQTRPDGHDLPQSLNQGMSPVGRPVICI